MSSVGVFENVTVCASFGCQRLKVLFSRVLTLTCGCFPSPFSVIWIPLNIDGLTSGIIFSHGRLFINVTSSYSRFSVRLTNSWWYWSLLECIVSIWKYWHSHKELNLCTFLFQANLSTSTQTHYGLRWDPALRISFVGAFRGSYAIMMDSRGRTNATIMKVKICLQWLVILLLLVAAKMLNSACIHVFSYLLLVLIAVALIAKLKEDEFLRNRNSDGHYFGFPMCLFW